MPVLFLSVILISAVLFAAVQPLRFRRLADAFFKEELSGDTLSMHYVLADPQAYGIPADAVSFPAYSPELQTQAAERYLRYERTADTIPAFFLDDDSRLLLALLRDYLKTQRQEGSFSYYYEPLSPYSGIQASLPVLLAEYSFRSKQDVENYLSLLAQIPAFLDGAAAYEREKAAAGLFMPDACADRIIEQCRTILEGDSLKDDTHFLSVTFAERLFGLQKQGLLTQTEAAAYLEENRGLLLTRILPAYQELGRQLGLLKGQGRNPDGLAYFPEGKEYYALLLRQTTGSDREIARLEDMLAARLEQDARSLTLLLSRFPSLPSVSLPEYFPSLTPKEYLQDLQKRIEESFPALPGQEASPVCTVKDVSPSLQKYCSPAFYLTPPIDDMTENSIYINPANRLTGLDLYTTLAHEGYPGHLYQTVYYQRYQQEARIHPARNLLRCGGYTEGWALYVEMLSYEYVKDALRKSGAPLETLSYVDAMRLNRSIQLCLYSLLDIEIHYHGAKYETVRGYLSAFGITENGVAKNIYEYIVEEPANYPKYYIGYLEFTELKKDAQTIWKEGYSDLRFHTAVLNAGPCPFPALRSRLFAESRR